MKSCSSILMALLACTHSDPVTVADRETTGPFSPTHPILLTYSGLNDGGPGFSADGAWITYNFQGTTPDRDQCIGVLPLQGGQRRWELCPWAHDQVLRSDGLSNAALRADGMMAFTMHSGRIGELTSTAAALYLAPVDSVAGAVRLLPLLARPPGGTRTWQDLVDPVWIADDELLVLAARRHLVNMRCVSDESCPYDLDRSPPIDTLQIGIEVARMRVSPIGVAMLQVVPATEAIGWSVDTSNDVMHLVVQRADSGDLEFYHESIADTLFAIPISGGPMVPRYGTPSIGERVAERIHGVASARGRVFISRSWRRPVDVQGATIILPGTRLMSDISEVMPDGSLRLIAPQLSWRWGRLRLSPDGQIMVAEALERTSMDVYRINIGP